MRVLRPLLAAMAMAALLPMSALAGPADPFRGAWFSEDVVDGSDQRLTFGGAGSTRMITLVDSDATVACGGGPAIVKGTGTIAGDEISGTLTVLCANGSPSFDIDATFTHDAGTNTLDDSFGTTWTRH